MGQYLCGFRKNRATGAREEETWVDLMDDWGDLAPGALTYTAPVATNTFQPVMSGPQPAGDPTAPPNQQAGDMILPRGASIQLSGGGAIRNDGRASDFEISEDVGFLARGVGIALASLMTSAYATAPIDWYSEASFIEVLVTAAYAPPSTTQFYSDAFKQDVTGDLTVSAVVDNGDSWTITFTGAALTADYQVGNMIDPDWAAPWWQYLPIIANGTDWVEVLKTGVTAPVATNTFSIHGVYANVIAGYGKTWQAPYALWFTGGDNIAGESIVSAVNRTNGLVTLTTAQAVNIAAGDRLKAWDERATFHYQWNLNHVMMAPSSRDPDNIDLRIGGGGTYAGALWEYIYMWAKNGIYICPTYNVHDKTAHVASGYPGYRAHLAIDKGNFTLTEGYAAIKALAQPAAVADHDLMHLDSAYNLLKITHADGQVQNLLAQPADAENGFEIITY